MEHLPKVLSVSSTCSTLFFTHAPHVSAIVNRCDRALSTHRALLCEVSPWNTLLLSGRNLAPVQTPHVLHPSRSRLNIGQCGVRAEWASTTTAPFDGNPAPPAPVALLNGEREGRRNYNSMLWAAQDFFRAPYDASIPHGELSSTTLTSVAIFVPENQGATCPATSQCVSVSTKRLDCKPSMQALAHARQS